MRRTGRGGYAGLAALLLLGLAAAAGPAAAATAPAGFSDTVVTTLPGPTGLGWTPDGRMLVTQQAGLLRVVPGACSTPRRRST